MLAEGRGPVPDKKKTDRKKKSNSEWKWRVTMIFKDCGETRDVIEHI